MKLPLFPLSAHILPGGRMALRIFEPRYVRMIKQACSGSSGFVMCMLNSNGDKADNSHIFPIGTKCQVIDFNVLEDGLLGITIEGLASVNVSEIEAEQDGLRVGHCEVIERSGSSLNEFNLHPLDQRLREIFQRYPEVSGLYAETHFDNPEWVIYRWIELLPIGAEQKQQFITQKDYTKVLQYLTDLIE